MSHPKERAGKGRGQEDKKAIEAPIISPQELDAIVAFAGHTGEPLPVREILHELLEKNPTLAQRKLLAFMQGALFLIKTKGVLNQQNLMSATMSNEFTENLALLAFSSILYQRDEGKSVLSRFFHKLFEKELIARQPTSASPQFPSE